jgi:hypothetical protein
MNGQRDGFISIFCATTREMSQKSFMKPQSVRRSSKDLVLTDIAFKATASIGDRIDISGIQFIGWDPIVSCAMAVEASLRAGASSIKGHRQDLWSTQANDR